MTKLVLTTASAELYRHWVTFPKWEQVTVTASTRSLPLSSTFDIRYLTLINKIDKLRTVPEEGDDAEFFVSEDSATVAKAVIRQLEKLKLIEDGIAIHVFSNYEKGIQIELDGYGYKADITALENGQIEVTSYIGELNEARTERIEADALFLISGLLNLNEQLYA